MILEGLNRSIRVETAQALREVLAWRDAGGGAHWWLAGEVGAFPALAMTFTGPVAELHFFAQASHPGFRCVGGEGLPEDGETLLVYEGCDPGDGIQTPNEFIIRSEQAADIAAFFLANQAMSDAVAWLEL